jgi:2-oxoglutarate dehydrogenase complex dehydrogenase (E1) component-like enzyme
MDDRLRRLSGQSVSARYIGRVESASTATGYLDTHRKEQRRIVDEALSE